MFRYTPLWPYIVGVVGCFISSSFFFFFLSLSLFASLIYSDAESGSHNLLLYNTDGQWSARAEAKPSRVGSCPNGNAVASGERGGGQNVFFGRKCWERFSQDDLHGCFGWRCAYVCLHLLSLGWGGGKPCLAFVFAFAMGIQDVMTSFTNLTP